VRRRRGEENRARPPPSERLQRVRRAGEVVAVEAEQQVGHCRRPPNFFHLLTQLGSRPRVLIETDARDGGFPRLVQRPHARRGAAGVREDPTARHVEQVDRLRSAVRFGRLQTGLAGRDDRQN
jgi:hypothetical protein